MDRIGYVYFHGHMAGKIIETSKGFRFLYESNYILSGTPLGYNYPLSQTSFFRTSLFPIFENLISEGWLLDLQSSSQHVDKLDKFGLLLKNGKDLIGAITVLEEIL